MKKVKPPETSNVWIPLALAPAINSLAPRFRRKRSLKTPSSALSGTPFRRATRRRKLSLKSLISPRIAASVISDTSFFFPTASAISSIHSILIRVESISMANTLIWLGSKCLGKNPISVACKAHRLRKCVLCSRLKFSVNSRTVVFTVFGIND